MIYPFKGPLVRPSTESAALEERGRREDEDDSEQGDGQGGQDRDEQDGDSFGADEMAAKQREKALGGKQEHYRPREAAPEGVTSVWAIRTRGQR